MMSRAPGLLLLLGCAGGRAPAPAPEAPADTGRVAAEEAGWCVRQAGVTLHVENRGSADVEITFGAYWTPGRAAPGLSRTTYRVPRAYLAGYIGLRIRGGLRLGPRRWIPTEYVVCNDATLIIGAEPGHSFFYGDLVGLGWP